MALNDVFVIGARSGDEVERTRRRSFACYVLVRVSDRLLSKCGPSVGLLWELSVGLGWLTENAAVVEKRGKTNDAARQLISVQLFVRDTLKLFALVVAKRKLFPLLEFNRISLFVVRAVLLLLIELIVFSSVGV